MSLLPTFSLALSVVSCHLTDFTRLGHPGFSQRSKRGAILSPLLERTSEKGLQLEEEFLLLSKDEELPAQRTSHWWSRKAWQAYLMPRG